MIILKSRIPRPEEEIKYVSRILRKKFKRKKVSENCDHQYDYYKNFWKYCEKNLESYEESVKPLITESDCENYVKSILSKKKIVKNVSCLHRG